MDREAHLTATLRDWRRSSFDWGSTDCMLSTADYAGALNGTDPGAAYRGRYDDEAGAMAFVDAAGGGAAILGAALVAAGFKRVQQPQRGDPVVAQIGHNQIGGICLGDFCVFRTSTRGVVEIRTSRLTILGAWRA